MFKKKIVRKVILILTILVAFFCETTVSQIFSMSVAFPNLLILVTTIVGFISGRREGMYAGFLSGMILDLSYGQVLGYHCLILLYIGFICGLFHRLYFSEDVLMPIALVALSDFFYNFVYYVLNFMMRGKMDFRFYFVHNILPEVIFTVILTLLTYRLFYKVNEKLEVFEKGNVNLID